jgi:hypothetical protein
MMRVGEEYQTVGSTLSIERDRTGTAFGGRRTDLVGVVVVYKATEE